MLRAGSIAAIAVIGATANAQSVFDSVRTGNGYCHIWVAPPGGSNPPDLSYSPCAVDRHPKRLSGPDIPAPTLGLIAGGDFFIAIRPDGTVDSALTRPWSEIGRRGDTSVAVRTAIVQGGARWSRHQSLDQFGFAQRHELVEFAH